MILEITKSNFNDEVLNSDKKVIVDFWAEWCNPCKMMHPVLEKLNEEVGDKIKIGKINIDIEPELTSSFGVMSIPTFIVFENGQMLKSVVGMQSLEKLKELLEV